jgi:hypothetical protein
MDNRFIIERIEKHIHKEAFRVNLEDLLRLIAEKLDEYQKNIHEKDVALKRLIEGEK